MTERLERSSGNVFADVGFPPEEAANLLLRSQLMLEVERALDRRADDGAAARTLGVRRSRLTDLRRGRIERFDVDELVAMLGRLGLEVRLTTHRTGSKGRARDAGRTAPAKRRAA